MTKNKTTITLAILLILTITLTIAALPATNAQATMRTYAFIGATPNPVGVSQDVLLHVGITTALQAVAEGWEGLTVTVTKPDGTTQTLGPFRTDSTGGTGYVYVPSVVGNYTLQTRFPEQVTTSTKRASGAAVGTVMLASESEKLTLVVKEEPNQYWPGVPLPTEYWTRPIHASLYEWHSIGGNWLRTYSSGGVSRFVPYNDDAPESAHILWAKPLAGGGLAGGLIGLDNLTHSYECGAAYVPKFENAIVIAGVLYYERYEGSRGLPYVEQEVVAVDLKTGKEIWAKPLIGRTGNTTGATVVAANRLIDGKSDQFPNGIPRGLYMGQVFYWDSYNYHGVYGLLWTVTGTTWMAFDAHTGRWIYTITDVPSGTILEGTNGEILRLQVNLAQGRMALWNSSNLVSQAGSWNPHGNVYNASGVTAPGVLATGPARAWEWNKTIPAGLPGSVRETFLNDRVIGAAVSTTEVTIWGISLKPGQEGQLLFNATWKPPADWAIGNQTISWAGASADDKVGMLWSKETRQRWGFSLDTGKLIWGPSSPEHYLQIYGTATVIGYGKLYSTYMCGTVYCYDIKTGSVLWTYDARDELSELLWGNNWPLRVAFLTDGKLYLYSGEHSPVDPKPRGAPFICLDAETGKEIWKLTGMWFYYRANPTIGDSVISILNSYDNRIYTFGRGPSAIKVTAPETVQPFGTSILIRGMVTDISPGTDDIALQKRFPHGVPAVSDASMDAWMQYVYMQFPRPADATGVEVTLSVLDSNGNYREIGKTVSNSDGFFTFNWKPDIEGQYTVYASFAGSESYWPSHAVTAFTVDPAPPAPAEPEPEPPSVADTYFLPAVAGIIAVLIVIVVLLAVLLLRKRP